MPIFEYECPNCKFHNEFLFFDSDKIRYRKCELCDTMIDLWGKKVPCATSFKIKGLRAANGYGLKFQDSYGVNKVDGAENGYSFTGKDGKCIDHNQGSQNRKAEDSRTMAERKESK